MFRVARRGAGDEPPATHAPFPRPPRADRTAAIGAVVAQLQGWRARRDARQTYRALMRLDDRQLDDLGLSRHELRRRLWRDGPSTPDVGATVDDRPLAWLVPMAGGARRPTGAA